MVGQLAVWRAAQQVHSSDPGVTGPPATNFAARRWQQHLNDNSGASSSPSTSPLVKQLTAAADHDPFRDTLALHLTRLAGQGVDVDRHLKAAAAEQPLPDDHPSAALWWRLHRQLPAATLTPTGPTTEPIEPLWQPTGPQPHPTSGQPGELSPTTREARTDTALLVAGLQRIAARRPAPDPQSEPAAGAGERQRLLGVNQLANDFYRNQLPGSWADRYLTDRCGQDLADDTRFQPGHAPPGWTALVDHLRRLDVPENDMLGAGLAIRTRQGRLVDRFRDRATLPIWSHDQDLIGFVARRRPDLDDAQGGPKYLNTPTTALYTKGNQLYGNHLLPPTRDRQATNPGSDPAQVPVPVLVEGPLDAIAVTLAGGGRYIGLATLGTSLTQPQALTLARTGVDPVLAPDGDPAGQAAATRNFWRLTQHRLDPLLAVLPPKLDPADILNQLGPDRLLRLLQEAAPQSEHLLRHSGPHQPERHRLDVLLRIVAVRPPHTWADSIDDLSRRHQTSVQELRERLIPLAQDATRHPTATAHRGEALTASPTRHAGPKPPVDRQERQAQPRRAATAPSHEAQTPMR